MTAGRLGRSGGRHAKAFEVDEFLDAFWANACVHRGDMAAHAVAQQVDLSLAHVVVEQLVKVRKIVGKPEVVSAGRLSQAKASPIGGNDPMVVFQGVDHELKRGCHIHPSMLHKNFRRIFCTPMHDMRA
jgi:hypothetical protein